jgi:hypothetical protein
VGEIVPVIMVYKPIVSLKLTRLDLWMGYLLVKLCAMKQAPLLYIVSTQPSVLYARRMFEIDSCSLGWRKVSSTRREHSATLLDDLLGQVKATI